MLVRQTPSNYHADSFKMLLHSAVVIGCILAGRVAVDASAKPADPCDPNPEAVDVGNRSTCTFTRTVHRDPTRIPPEWAVFECKCPGTLCAGLGDYRCQEVKERVHVAYVVAGSSELRWVTLKLTVACVCAASRSSKAVQGQSRIEGGTDCNDTDENP